MKFELTNTKLDDEQEPITWVKWHEDLKKEGDSFVIRADTVSFKDEGSPVFYVIDNESNTGTSVFCAHHPNAKFTDATPDGVRLANAAGRFLKIEGSVEATDLAESLTSEKKIAVKVEKTAKGRLWSIVKMK